MVLQIIIPAELDILFIFHFTIIAKKYILNIAANNAQNIQLSFMAIHYLVQVVTFRKMK